MSDLAPKDFLLTIFEENSTITKILERFARENYDESNFYFCLDLENRTELLSLLVKQNKTDSLTIPFILEMFANITRENFGLRRLIQKYQSIECKIDSNNSDDFAYIVDNFNSVDEKEKLIQLEMLFGDSSVAEIFFEFTKELQKVDLGIWCNLADGDERCKLFIKVCGMIDISLLTNSTVINICEDVIRKLVSSKTVSEEDFESICADHLFY